LSYAVHIDGSLAFIHEGYSFGLKVAPSTMVEGGGGTEGAHGHSLQPYTPHREALP